MNIEQCWRQQAEAGPCTSVEYSRDSTGNRPAENLIETKYKDVQAYCRG